MENKRLIIILLGIVAILLVALVSIMIVTTRNNPSEITITSQNTLNDGSKLTLTLNDKNKTPIANQEIDISIIDASGQKNQQKITTDKNGNGELQLNGLTEGQYTIQAKYNGNMQYKNSQTNQTLTISNQVTVTSIASQTSSSSADTTESVISEDGYSYKTGYGPDYDHLGVSREEAAAKGWHYLPCVIDGEDCGTYTPYDPVAGCYHD